MLHRDGLVNRPHPLQGALVAHGDRDGLCATSVTRMIGSATSAQEIASAMRPWYDPQLVTA